MTIFTKIAKHMDNVLYSIILIVFLAAYIAFLYKKTGRNRDGKVMAWAFISVFTAGLVLHLIIYWRLALSKGTAYDFLTLIFFSVQHSLKMFLAGSPIYKMLSDFKDFPGIYYVYVPVFYMAVITSAFFIFNFISRVLYSRRWLGKKDNAELACKGGNSIFLGVNRYSVILAKGLREDPEKSGKIIFIELPDKNDAMAKLSIWDVLKQFLNTKPKKTDVPYDIILKVKDNMKGLMPWLENPDNDVYVLSDDVTANVQIVEKLLEHPEIRCHVYCHARKEGLIAKYDNVADLNNQLTIIDSSILAVEGLKRTPDLHPVNFVEVGTDEEGRKAGWISDKGFTSAILGFGETGKECLSFLYEFGSFPDINKNKAPFKCHVFDNNLEKASSDFIRRAPGMNLSEIDFISDGIDTPSYWMKIKELTDKLNYVMISLGDDKRNLNTAIELAEHAFRYRKSDDPHDNLKNFVILFRLCDPENIDLLTLNSANEVFGNCLRPFGDISDIWKYDIISRRSIDAFAERYHNSYETLANGFVEFSWKEKLRSRSMGSYKDRCKAQRQVAQTYSNCLHMETKKRLCDPYYHTFAEHIATPDDFDGTRHYTGVDEQIGKILEYLAVGEKLRWNASHEILGYVKGDETDDQLKKHQYICAYHEVDARVRHYDWLVVRNSLI